MILIKTTISGMKIKTNKKWMNPFYNFIDN